MGITKKIVIILLILSMVIAFIPLKALATDTPKKPYTLTFTIDSKSQGYHDAKQDKDVQHSMKMDGTYLQIDGQYVEPRETQDYTSVVEGDTAAITINNGAETTLNYNSANNFELFANGKRVDAGTIFTEDTAILVQDYPKSNNPQVNNENPEENNNPQENNNSQGQNNPIPQSGGDENIEFDINFTNTHYNVWINSLSVMSDEDGTLRNEFKGTINKAGTTDSKQTNKLRFIETFGDLPVTEYVINGITYKEGMEEFSTDDRGTTITVPGAKKYVVTGTGDTSFAPPRTIIWTNPGYVAQNKEDEEWTKGFSLEHGSAYIKAVYDEEGKVVNPETYLSNNWDKKDIDRGVGKDNFGWVSIKPGSKVIFEFVPEYGYQLTDIRINEQPLGVTETINEFEFIMPNTNIHFDAEFTKTEDILKANSKKISSGNISLGKNVLSGGSAQLTVNDIELDSSKIKGFEKAAGDYKISNYLDIDLYQVFYKGKKDADDVWQNKIDELDNEVTISIKLEEGVNADDIVIVHNIHDGEEYEVIKIDSYDAKTNTITFKTRSFSNYAIAEKVTVKENKVEESKENNSEENIAPTEESTEVKEESNEKTSSSLKTSSNPKTGDNIIVFVIAFVIATLGIFAIIKFNKDNK